MSHDKRTDRFYCDFCGKAQHEVEQIIRGPLVEICDECVLLAQQRIDESRACRAALAANPLPGETEGGGDGLA